MRVYETLLIWAGILIFSACSGELNEEVDSLNDREEAQEELSEFEELIQNGFDEKEFPYQSAVNFDNFNPKEFLTEDEFDLLELFFVFPEGWINERYTAKDRLVLESGVTLISVVFKDNEHELSTYLITYSKDGWYADNVRIAYDEIAEGFLRIESTIEGNTITRTTTITFDEPIVEKEKYFIQDDGKIIWEEDL